LGDFDFSGLNDFDFNCGVDDFNFNDTGFISNPGFVEVINAGSATPAPRTKSRPRPPATIWAVYNENTSTLTSFNNGLPWENFYGNQGDGYGYNMPIKVVGMLYPYASAFLP
jgi:hypothetical protein